MFWQTIRLFCAWLVRSVNKCFTVLQDTESSEAIKDMRQGLDSNQDGKVSFQEYMTLVGYLAQSLSEQRCLKETQVANSDPETQAQASAPEASKAEPEAEKEAKPVKEEEPAKELDDDDVVEVVGYVEEDEGAVEVVEAEERT